MYCPGFSGWVLFSSPLARCCRGLGVSWAPSLVMSSPWLWCCCCCCSPPVVVPLSPRGCWVVVSLAASVDPCWPIAPPIHPVSSCSQRWRWVLGHVLVFVPPVVVPFFCGCWCRWCVIVVILWSWPSSVFPLASAIPPPWWWSLAPMIPPARRGGAALGLGLGCSPSSFLSPRSCCCCCCCCCWCSCPVIPTVVVSPCCCCCPCCPPPHLWSFPPLAPPICPASRCSQQQGWGLGLGRVSLGAGAGAVSLVPCPLHRGQAAPAIHPTSSYSLA